ncbi:hypothetical protein ASF62_04905 [Leifsonia sp. Leaf325]|nr:hypothetical protein [Leifsonia sp. Leaf325]KQQ95824.1 hypothetical protein ASF62_04905 [Leifsonia sp. Leaf325]
MIDTDTSADVERDISPRRSARPRQIGTLVFAAVGAAVLSLLYGLTPLAIRSSVIFYIATGRIDCGVSSLRDAARSYCDLVGGPLGGLFATNLPIIQPAVLISRLTGMPPEWSYALMSWVVLAAGLYGGYRFLRLVAVRSWLAMAGSLAYAASLNVFGVLGFGGMLFGAVLLPSLAFIVLSTLRRLRRAGALRKLGWLAGWTALATAMLFADGYTAIMGSALAAVLVLSSGWGRWRSGASWLGLAALAGITAVSYLLYKAIIPNAGSWGVDDLDKFRAFGLDLSTLFVPSDAVWWAELLGIGRDSSTLWGDGSNSQYNYLGIVMVGLAIVGVIMHARGARRTVIALTVVGLAALAVAVGPTLKIAALYDPSLSDAATSMPAGSGVVDLPTSWLFTHVPGVEYMRAIYRWVLLLRLAVVVLAVVGVEALLRRRKRVLAITLGVIAVVEVAFNPVAAVQTNLGNAQEMSQFNRDVVDPMSEAFGPDDRVVFVSGTPKANDYLSVYLAPKLDIHTWNIGNDKALRRARAAWPSRIDQLIARQPQGDKLKDLTASVLEDGTVTKVVVLDFDLRENAKAWPPNDRTQERGEAIADTLEADDRFTVDRHEYFDVVTLAE